MAENELRAKIGARDATIATLVLSSSNQEASISDLESSANKVDSPTSRPVLRYSPTRPALRTTPACHPSQPVSGTADEIPVHYWGKRAGIAFSAGMFVPSLISGIAPRHLVAPATSPLPPPSLLSASPRSHAPATPATSPPITSSGR